MLSTHQDKYYSNNWTKKSTIDAAATEVSVSGLGFLHEEAPLGLLNSTLPKITGRHGGVANSSTERDSSKRGQNLSHGVSQRTIKQGKSQVQFEFEPGDQEYTNTAYSLEKKLMGQSSNARSTLFKDARKHKRSLLRK